MKAIDCDCNTPPMLRTYRHNVSVFCHNRLCPIDRTGIGATEEEAIEDWNRTMQTPNGPMCVGNPTKEDCRHAGYCRREFACND